MRPTQKHQQHRSRRRWGGVHQTALPCHRSFGFGGRAVLAHPLRTSPRPGGVLETRNRASTPLPGSVYRRNHPAGDLSLIDLGRGVWWCRRSIRLLHWLSWRWCRSAGLLPSSSCTRVLERPARSARSNRLCRHFGARRGNDVHWCRSITTRLRQAWYSYLPRCLSASCGTALMG